MPRDPALQSAPATSAPVARLSFCALGHIGMRCFIVSVFCLALVGCGLDQSLSRSDKPVSREAASKDIAIPFPASASDVYYVVHSGGMQEFQLFARFSVAPPDTDRAVADILSDHDKRMQMHGSYTSVPVADGMRWSQMSSMASALLPMPWWDTDSITNGYYWSSTNVASDIHVWVDAPHHQIYLCIHD